MLKQADSLDEKLKFRGLNLNINHVLVWTLKRVSIDNSLETSDAKKILNSQLKDNDCKLFFQFLMEVQKLLRNERELTEKQRCNMNNIQLKTDQWRLNIIKDITSLESIVKSHVDRYTADSLRGVFQCVLDDGWGPAGSGKIFDTYIKFKHTLIDKSTQKISELQLELNKLKSQVNNKKSDNNVKNFEKDFGKKRDYKRDYNKRGYDRNNKFQRDFRGHSSYYNDSRYYDDRSRGRTNNKYRGRGPMPQRGRPGPIPPDQCMPNSQLLRVLGFCDKYQFGNCNGDYGRCTFEHSCSYCGDKRHGRFNCSERPANNP